MKSLIMALLCLLITLPAFAAFEDHYELKEYDQAVFDSFAGESEYLKNKTDNTAFCSVYFGKKKGAIYIIPPGKTTMWEYQPNAGGRSVSCVRYDRDMEYKYDNFMKIAKSFDKKIKGEFFKTCTGCGQPFNLKHLPDIRNVTSDTYDGNQNIGMKLTIYNNGDYVYTCKMKSANSGTSSHILIPPKSKSFMYITATQEGLIQLDQSCRKIRPTDNHNIESLTTHYTN